MADSRSNGIPLFIANFEAPPSYSPRDPAATTTIAVTSLGRPPQYGSVSARPYQPNGFREFRQSQSGNAAVQVTQPLISSASRRPPAQVTRLTRDAVTSLKMSIFLSLLWGGLLSPHLLVLTIPAYFIVKSGLMMARNGDIEGGKRRIRCGLFCNIISIVGGVFGFIIAATIGLGWFTLTTLHIVIIPE